MKRLENGLIEGITYIYDPKGKIDWIKMIPSEYLYVNPMKKEILEKRLEKTFDTITTSEVADTDLVITLQGIRYLLDLRGFHYAKTTLDVAGPDFAAATCEISFLPNIEENFPQVYTGNACAHLSNTKSFMRSYLVEAASNRALCRAVRSFLKINIVSKEEIGESTPVDDEETKTSKVSSPHDILEKVMREHKVTFEKIKEKLVKENYSNAGDFQSIQDIPKAKILDLIGKIKQNLEKKKSAA